MELEKEFDIEKFKISLPNNVEERNLLIQAEIIRQTKIMNDNTGVEQASKVMLNSIYGAIASPYFTGFNTDVAEAITLQGQDLIKYSEVITNKYFMSIWHLDKELHAKLGITVHSQITAEVTLYIDTDSTKSDSILRTESGKMTIEEYFNSYGDYDGYQMDERGNEIIYNPKNSVLNWDYRKELYYAKVAKIVRHKVTKPMWKLKTKSGKEIIVTNDHSLIVFRDGKKIEVKAAEIDVKNDKILTVMDI